MTFSTIVREISFKTASAENGSFIFNKSGLLSSTAPNFYTKKPDLDKLARAIGDACSIDAPLLKDDSQIMRLICAKRYQIGTEPCGVHIALTVL